MNKLPAISLLLSSLLGVGILSFAADGIEPPTPSSTGPTNPTPPTLPVPGSGDQNGTGIDAPGSAPAREVNGADREGPEGHPPMPSQRNNPERKTPGKPDRSSNE